MMLRILFFLLMVAPCTFGQLNHLQAVVVNVPETGVFGTYQKVEVGVQLPNQTLVRVENFVRKARVSNAEKINPYLAWELDVMGEFKHEASGKTMTVPGFYYKEFERDTVKNTYVEKSLQQSIRIRFAPPLSGNWVCEVRTKVKGKASDEVVKVAFTVVDSESKGFVKVHPNQRDLTLGDHLFYPVGINFPSPTKGVRNYHNSEIPGGPAAYEPNQTNMVAKPKDWLRYLSDIKRYGDSGGKYIRTLQSGWGSLLEFEEKGNYTNRLHYAWEQDQLLEMCEREGMYIYFNLMEQEPFMKFGNYYLFDWDWWQYRSDGTYDAQHPYPPYCYSDGLEKEPHEMFLDPDDLRYHEQRLRYYVARYGYSTSIYLFELLSEPWHLDQLWPKEEVYAEDSPAGDLVRKAICVYQTTMARYAKEQLHIQQLIGIDIFNATMYKGEKFIDSSIYSPYIDVISYNPYSSVPEKLIIAKSESNNSVEPGENSQYGMVNMLHTRAQKPVLIAEGGGGDGVDENCDYAQQKLDMMAFGFCGVAGFNSWIGWYDGHEVNWPSVIAAQEYFNSPEFTIALTSGGGHWVQGRQAEKVVRKDKKKIKELQYYVAQDGLYAAGYVKNRTFNFHTQLTKPVSNDYLKDDPTLGTPRNISSDQGKPLFVEGLTRGKTLEITWYDFVTGKVISVETVKSKKRLELKHPVLTAIPGSNIRPMVWFTVRVTR